MTLSGTRVGAHQPLVRLEAAWCGSHADTAESVHTLPGWSLKPATQCLLLVYLCVQSVHHAGSRKIVKDRYIRMQTHPQPHGCWGVRGLAHHELVRLGVSEVLFLNHQK